jgi:hypothetical protein
MNTVKTKIYIEAIISDIDPSNLYSTELHIVDDIVCIYHADLRS